MQGMDGFEDIAAGYDRFTLEAADSPCFAAWAAGVRDDPEVLALLATLPVPKRQPNLVFAAARWHGAVPGAYRELREVLLERWPEVSATVLERATQTNEVGRCATLLPLLASLPQPLALLEVGASAGLCLQPDRYSYIYDVDTGESVTLDPNDGPSPVRLRCSVGQDVPLPTAPVEVVWRAGVDLNPLDVTDRGAMRWLETLVWPEAEERRARLRGAIDIARAEPPRLVRGDLLAEVPALAAQAPSDATLVVFHSAVIAYLDPEGRRAWDTLARELPGHWISNEGPTVLPAVTATATSPAPAGTPFALALDGVVRAWSHPHGRSLHWC
ncbi:DUF2332 domain-containing protein [Janibacter sp. G1551]|uniref:DUF2332 domain-containing protein n=1 Tax=Janibacter sp. G1551 TaxID=3420440 RepID=UPI003D0130F0